MRRVLTKTKRRPMRLNQFGEAMINFLPNFIRHHRFQRRLREFDRQIHFAAMADVDDFAIGIASFVDARVPTRKRATSSIGFCVAESPMRCSGFFACRRSGKAGQEPNVRCSRQDASRADRRRQREFRRR